MEAPCRLAGTGFSRLPLEGFLSLRLQHPRRLVILLRCHMGWGKVLHPGPVRKSEGRFESGGNDGRE